ncbi:DUF4810 domain-containing protein [Shewanella sp. OPT22]|nr:DUF4810 domain-containing protein [Shewanella sp. OPT22]
MKLKTIAFMILAIGLVGCKATNTLYHWGDYNHTLYNYTKEPTDETKKAHMDELKNIITTAEEKNKKVAPGIHYELAMMEAEAGNLDVAKAHLAKEKELFPESKTAVKLAMREIGSL